jgi:preprotein translocase subunit SecB
MSETAPPAAEGQPIQPLTVNIQYVKDLSFEVPGAPEIYTTLRSQPNVSINLDVQARRIQEGHDVFEVVLQIKAEATEPQAPAANGQSADAQPANGQPTNGQAAEARPVFIAELSYAGVFTLNGVPENTVEPVLLVECPRLLFPYARNILADVTRDGGFPPVLLQPIDFVSLWQSRRAPGATATV